MTCEELFEKLDGLVPQGESFCITRELWRFRGSGSYPDSRDVRYWVSLFKGEEVVFGRVGEPDELAPLVEEAVREHFPAVQSSDDQKLGGE